MKGRIGIISMFVLLLFATVMIIGSAISSVSPKSDVQASLKHDIMIKQEAGSFIPSSIRNKDTTVPEGERSLKNYYNNRAYLGAPPMITHPLLSEKGIGGKACLQCHQNGGFVKQFEAFAPVTPHPTWLNCRQCHLPEKTNAFFKDINWDKITPPTLGNSALVTSPLIMPHGLQNRENCLSCHSGPAAPKEIRVTHPERINCRQCHVPKNTEEVFFTPVGKRQSQFNNNGTVKDESKFIGELDVEEIRSWIEKDNE